ncbi:MAG: glucans biosynthesis glucosyltransferase MdoH [Aestuariivita sp.]|nr:glucans biosynthesis glucosyltransferase MdoH [Aestuariivita sp.]MCY4289035.1 glucans biosynthesis glucosyltransferase MdoH [Aestuariivita sp.]
MTALMPDQIPLRMPTQDLRSGYQDANAPGTRSSWQVQCWRVAVFCPTLMATSGLAFMLRDWFNEDGYGTLATILILLIAFNFFWISFAFFNVVVGAVSLVRNRLAETPKVIPSLQVALLVPIHNEVPWYVLGNAVAMLRELGQQKSFHTYHLFILSDTNDDVIADQEERAINALRLKLAPELSLYYRRRTINHERKVGNISDWVRRWGGGYSAMIVLDADSLMTGQAIDHLANTMASDASVGLVQSFPSLVNAKTVFGRTQQFANGIFGAVFAEGLAQWAGKEGNYWGHNAIIRTRAFAACAGLPSLSRRDGRKSLILSHDFVEASLIRRAGWGVRFLTGLRGSYEETPATLIDHIKRDRRWCCGNLQHLRLLFSNGFHSVSRFHLLHGAVGYLLSALWLILLVFWALLGNGGQDSVLSYFSPDNPLIPAWPVMNEGQPVFFLLLMYATLLAPKLIGVAVLPLTELRYRDLGGTRRFFTSVLIEIVLSVLYAPILIVQQMIAVVSNVVGLPTNWEPQSREGGRYSLKTHLRYHCLETVMGVGLTLGILMGLVTLWLLPIAVSLALAVPLSLLSGYQLPDWAKSHLATAETFSEPSVIGSAVNYRYQLREYLNHSSMKPAE